MRLRVNPATSFTPAAAAGLERELSRLREPRLVVIDRVSAFGGVSNDRNNRLIRDVSTNEGFGKTC